MSFSVQVEGCFFPVACSQVQRWDIEFSIKNQHIKREYCCRNPQVSKLYCFIHLANFKCKNVTIASVYLKHLPLQRNCNMRESRNHPQSTKSPTICSKKAVPCSYSTYISTMCPFCCELSLMAFWSLEMASQTVGQLCILTAKSVNLSKIPQILFKKWPSIEYNLHFGVLQATVDFVLIS